MLKKALSWMDEIFSPTVLMQGQEYQQKGFVLNVRLSDGLLKARVKGQQGQIHDIYMNLKTWPNDPARCNCNTQFNCEHVVASLYALQSRENLETSSFSASNKHNLPVELKSEEIVWFSAVEEKGHHFFAYQLGILIDGEPVSIVPCVADLITRFDPKKLNTLPDHEPIKLFLPAQRTLQVSLGRIRPLIQFLLQYGDYAIKNKTNLTVNRYQLLLTTEIEQAMAIHTRHWQGEKVLREALDTLFTPNTLPVVAAPQGLHAVLRDYQQQGLNWLQFLRATHLGGILADDMGLGKTLQTLAHLQVEKEQGRINKASLIVVPASLLHNWLREAKRFTPELKVLLFHGAERREDFADYDIVVATYGLIQRAKARFINYSFYYLILDEAQFIKNAYTKTSQIIYQLKAEHRLCLSGTPLENHLGELWSLFHFLMPGFLGDSKQFREFFKIPIEKQGDIDKRSLLAKRVKPFLLRRQKSEVLQELPEKTEIILPVEITGKQRDLYEAVRMSMEKKVLAALGKQSGGHFVFLDALLKLRQVCCDPRLLSLPAASMAYGSSAKLDFFMELLNGLLEEGRRILVFSQFTSMLSLIEERLQAANYVYRKLTGQTRKRQVLIDEFQRGEIPVFLISLRAGGTGLNLTSADTVIHYDPWWNPAVENQASDRSHRIGQKNPVFVYKLITQGTVEEIILTMQKEKKQLFNKILSTENNQYKTLADNDFEQFFRPLPRNKS